MTLERNGILKSIYFQVFTCVVLVFVLYGKTLRYDFVLDDNLIVQNKQVQKGVTGVGAIFSSGYLSGFNGESSTYRPLPLVTFAIEKSIHDLDPFWSRFFHLLLYAISIFLLIRLATFWYNDYPKILLLFVGVLFLVNPIHTEVVCNLKSRDELLALIFILLTLIQVSKYNEKPSLKWIILSAISSLLALMSKENAVMVAPFVPLAFYSVYKADWKQVVKFSSGIFLAALTYFFIRILVLDSSQLPEEQFIINNAYVNTSIFERIGNSAFLLILYLCKVFIPYHLTWDYSYNTLHFYSLSSLPALLSVLTLVLAFSFLIWKRKCIRNSLFLVVGFVLFLITVLNLFVLIGANFAERFLFVPSVFSTMFFVVILHELIERKKLGIKTTYALLALVCFTYAVITVNREADWKDNESLFLASLKTNPESVRVQTLLGNNYREKAEQMQPGPKQEQLYRVAFSYYDEAIKILPEAYEAWYNKGVIYQQTGANELAINHFKEVIRIDSNHVNALNNLGVIYYNSHTLNLAEKYWTQAYSLSKTNPEVVGNMGVLYHAKRDYNKAVEFYTQSLKLNPDQPIMQQNLQVASSMLMAN